MSKRTSKSTENGIIVGYLEGATFVDLAAKFSVSGTTISNILRRGGVELRGHAAQAKFCSKTCEAILEGVRSGSCITSAAKAAGLHVRTVYHWRDECPEFAASLKNALAERGDTVEERNTGGGRRHFKRGKMVSRYAVDETFFKDIRTEEQAYFLGLIAADGCIADKGRRLSVCLKDSDREILECMRTAMRSTVPIYRCWQKGHTVQATGRYVKPGWTCRIVFRSRPLIADLRNLGVTERKSFTAEPWGGPAHLMPHYWRGCFDGDGCLHRLKHQPNSFGVAFCGSFAMVEAFRQFAVSVVPSRAATRPLKNIWVVAFRGRTAPKAITAALYGGATISLSRKHVLARHILES